MSSHPIDYSFQSLVYATPELLQLFDEKARIERWLSFEAALAESQGELGIIPTEAAQVISQTARLANLDHDTIRKGYTSSRNSVIPVLKALRQACGKTHGEFVHYGVTTQDVLDTGYVLELKALFTLLSCKLTNLITTICQLAQTHRTTPMVGRTHSQQALPITFGLKAAIWLGELLRHQERFSALSSRLFVGQIGGAVGTRAALGSMSALVAEKTCQRLDLDFSPLPWHTSRDTMAEAASLLCIVSGTLAKMCNEVFQLGKTEIGELREPAAQTATAGSSTMPHKRNPVLSERVVVLNSHIRSLQSVILEAMVHENERDPRALWSEWLAWPQISIYTGTALEYTSQVMDGLEVFPDRMLANLRLHKEAIASEWLLFHLGEVMGKMTAQENLSRIIKESQTSGKPLKELLLSDPQTASAAAALDLSMMDTPETYVGDAHAIVDGVIKMARCSADKNRPI